MARSRNIKPGFFKNEDLAECSLAARLCFIGLWTLADREGRLEDRPKRIKGELFPFESFDVEPLLRELEAHLFIVRYEISGQRFIQVSKFSTHQTPHYTEKDSCIKPPKLQESDVHDEKENLEHSRSVAVIKRGSLPPDSLIPDSLIPDTSSLRSEIAAPRKSAPPPTPPPVFDGKNAEFLNGKTIAILSAEFDLPEQWGLDAEALGFTPPDVLKQSEKFRQYWTVGRGEGTRRSVKGWRQTWSNWLEKAARDQR